MAEATITSKGQVTIPKEIREKMNLHAGDKIIFKKYEQGETIIKSDKKSIKDLRGILHRPGQEPKTVEGIVEYLEKKYRK